MNDDLIVSDPAVMILEAHPRLTRQGVLAALDFAKRVLRSDVVYPITRQSA